MGCLRTFGVQILMVAGLVFSLMTFIDCRFVTADLSLNTTDFATPPTFLPQSERQGYGFVWFENPADGKCWWDFWDSNENVREQEFEAYYDFVGKKWHASFGFALFSSFAGLLLWILSMILACLPHAKCLRFAVGLTLALLLTPAQGISFVSYASSFCDAYECEFGQSAGFSIGALLCYFFSGILVLTGGDYRPEDNIPGKGEQKSSDPQQEQKAQAGEEQASHEVKEDEHHGEETPVTATVY